MACFGQSQSMKSLQEIYPLNLPKLQLTYCTILAYFESASDFNNLEIFLVSVEVVEAASLF